MTGFGDEKPLPEVGSIWIDTDRRPREDGGGERRVRVVEVLPDGNKKWPAIPLVVYQNVTTYRRATSRLRRFHRAFRPAPQQDKD